MGSVWIAGSYQSDYARETLEISDMVAEAVTGTLDSAGVSANDVEARTLATLNIGDSLTTTVSFVVTRED